MSKFRIDFYWSAYWGLDIQGSYDLVKERPCKTYSIGKLRIRKFL